MNKYWFRKRRGLLTHDLGWGWVPITWEGWAVILSSLGIIVAASFSFDLYSGGTTFFQAAGFLVVVVAVFILGVFISHAKVRP